MKKKNKKKDLFLNSASSLKSGFNPILKNLSAKSARFELEAWFLQAILSSAQPTEIYLDVALKQMWSLLFLLLRSKLGQSAP